jgi:hypothetical protein
MTLAKVQYLKNQRDLDIHLERCDGTYLDEMKSLFRGLSAPIAGCFHMALVLSDAPFVHQDYGSFHCVYESKLKVLEIFLAQVGIESLDFFVAFSSFSGLIGLTGQSNYARSIAFFRTVNHKLIPPSACTVLNAVLAPYANAFSLITPGISDAGYLASPFHVTCCLSSDGYLQGSHQLGTYHGEV